MPEEEEKYLRETQRRSLRNTGDRKKRRDIFPDAKNQSERRDL